MLGRPIIKKQTGYGFYRPAAYQIANALADMPFSASRILIYDIIIYFMTHLHRSPGAFFTFHFINYVAFLTMQGFFRTIGLFFSNYHTAFRVAVFVFPHLVLYAGYMIPVNQMKRWLFWIVSLLYIQDPWLLILSYQFYINPVSYAWSALMENEFRHLTVCVPPKVLPVGFIHLTFSSSLLAMAPILFHATLAMSLNFRMVLSCYVKSPSSYTTCSVGLGSNQVCTLFGAQPGSSVVPGKDYIKTGYDLDTDDLWRRNFVVLFTFLLFFWFAQTVVIELFPVSHGVSRVLFKMSLTVSV